MSRILIYDLYDVCIMDIKRAAAKYKTIRGPYFAGCQKIYEKMLTYPSVRLGEVCEFIHYKGGDEFDSSDPAYMVSFTSGNGKYKPSFGITTIAKFIKWQNDFTESVPIGEFPTEEMIAERTEAKHSTVFLKMTGYITVEYLYHLCFVSNEWVNMFDAAVGLNQENISKIRIPLPPMSIQFRLRNKYDLLVRDFVSHQRGTMAPIDEEVENQVEIQVENQVDVDVDVD